MTWLIVGLSVSTLINVLLTWYIIQLLKRYLAFQDRIDDFVDKIQEYEGHVRVVNGLETFYGDETLGNLLKHSKNIVEDCNDFRLLYLINEEEDAYTEDTEEEDEINAP